MNRREFAIALAAGMASVSAGAAFAADGRIKIVMILKTLSSEYWETIAAGARAAAAQNDVDLTLLAPSGEDDVEQQIGLVQDVLARKPAALVFSPAQPEIAVNVLNKVRKAGIPVLLVDTGMPDTFTDYTTFIGTDNLMVGRIGGDTLAGVLKPGDKVFLLDGRPGNPTLRDRCDAAEETLKAAGIVIASRRAAYSDRERAYMETQELLRASPDIAGVFAGNDEQALGAARAFRQSGRSVPIIGVDATRAGLNAVLDGDLHASIAQDNYAMGRLGVEKALETIAGKSVDKRIATDATLITRDNARRFLDLRNQVLSSPA